MEYFKKSGIPTVLDTHNILWKSYDNMLSSSKFLPMKIKDWRIKKYKSFEENAWNKFDALIAINHNEYNYIKNVVKKIGFSMYPWVLKWVNGTKKRSIITTTCRIFWWLKEHTQSKDAMLCYENNATHMVKNSHYRIMDNW